MKMKFQINNKYFSNNNANSNGMGGKRWTGQFATH